MAVYNFLRVVVTDSFGGNVRVVRRQQVQILDPDTLTVAPGLTQNGQPVSAVMTDRFGRASFTATIPVVLFVGPDGATYEAQSRDLWTTITVGSVPFAASGEVSTTKAVRADDTRLTDARTPAAASIAADAEVSAAKVVRANDTRLTGNVTTNLANNTDLDTVTTPSTYYVQGSGTFPNRPEAGAGILRTYFITSTLGYQSWQTVSGTQSLYLRFRGSVGWAAWVRADAAGAVAQAATYTDSRVPRKALNTWRAARDARATTPARVVCFGDSRTEGTGTSDVSLRWQTLMQKHLRGQFGVTSGATFPFIPAYPQTSAPGFGVARAGTVTQDTTYGLGWRTARLKDATSQLTFTFTGTSFKIMHLRASATAVMSITIDGGAATIVNTNSVSGGGGASNAALWSSPALTRGTHTVVITRDASSTAGQDVYVQGLLTFDGDETSGLRVIDAGYHGASSTFFTTTRNNTAAAAVAAVGSVGLVIIAMGTNDTIGPTTPATYRANIEGLIAALRTSGGFSGSVILLNLTKPNSMTEALYSPYGEQMAAIAAADPLIEYVDMRREQPDNPTPYTATAGLGLYNDNVHEGDFGHAFIAGKMAAILGS